MPFRQVAVNARCYLHWDCSCVTLLPYSLITTVIGGNQLIWGVSVGDDNAGAVQSTASLTSS